MNANRNIIRFFLLSLFPKTQKVNDRILFQSKVDYFKILSEDLNQVFTNGELAKLAKISVRTARQITYCVRKGGVIRLARKNGRELLFQNV